MEENKRSISRRELLKILAATSGAAAASSILPDRWAKPILGSGVLPAHAQVSFEPDTIVELWWPIWMEIADLDLRGVGDGATVDDSNPTSPTMSWAYAEIPPQQVTEFTETITITTMSASGNYEIYVYMDSWSRQRVPQQEQREATLTITLPYQAPVTKNIIASLQLSTWVHCATIHFDTKTITWHV